MAQGKRRDVLTCVLVNLVIWGGLIFIFALLFT